MQENCVVRKGAASLLGRRWEVNGRKKERARASACALSPRVSPYRARVFSCAHLFPSACNAF